MGLKNQILQKQIDNDECIFWLFLMNSGKKIYEKTFYGHVTIWLGCTAFHLVVKSSFIFYRFVMAEVQGRSFKEEVIFGFSYLRTCFQLLQKLLQLHL